MDINKVPRHILDRHFKYLFYDLGEIDFQVLKDEAWDKYVNEDEPFSDAQMEHFKTWLENVFDEYGHRK